MTGPATLLTLFLMMVASDAHAAQAPCSISRTVYEAQMVAAKHPLEAEVDKKLVYPFIAFFNKVPPKSHFRADAIVAYEGAAPDNIRVAFFWRGCFLDDITFVRQGFVAMLMEVIRKRTDI